MSDEGKSPNKSPYSASKSGLLTEDLSRENITHDESLYNQSKEQLNLIQLKKEIGKK